MILETFAQRRINVAWPESPDTRRNPLGILSRALGLSLSYRYFSSRRIRPITDIPNSLFRPSIPFHRILPSHQRRERCRSSRLWCVFRRTRCKCGSIRADQTPERHHPRYGACQARSAPSTARPRPAAAAPARAASALLVAVTRYVLCEPQSRVAGIFRNLEVIGQRPKIVGVDILI